MHRKSPDRSRRPAGAGTPEKQIMTKTLQWTGFLATLALALLFPLYLWLEPVKQEQALEAYYTTAVVASTDLYAENCAVCHGAQGEGIGTNPPLDSDAVRQMSRTDLEKTIARGRFGTPMAAWAVEEGGVFTTAQIHDLATFLQQVNWEYVAARVEELGLTPPQVITLEVSAEALDALSALPNGDLLGEGLQLYAENCAACHGGNASGTLIAPALDSPEVRALSPEEIAARIREGIPGTLMAPWGGTLSEAQIAALAETITRWPEVVQSGVEFPEAPPADFTVTPEMVAAGERLFDIACKSCHGVDGYGTPMAPALNNQIFLSETPDAAIYQIIAGGVPGTKMPAWGTRLTDDEIRSLVAYLRSWEETAHPILPPIREP